MFTFDTCTGPPHATPCAARAGVLHLPHGPVRTPIFMPVATQAALKGVTVEQLEQLDVEIILGNTYHLALRPGEDTLRALTRRQHAEAAGNESAAATATATNKDEHKNKNKNEDDNNDDDVRDNMAGIHFLQGWRRNILTDSGGFQMVSLLKLARITEEGVRFQSTHGGSGQHTGTTTTTTTTTAIADNSNAKDAHEADDERKADEDIEAAYSLLLRPEDSIRIQNAIGGDVMMQLDDVVHVLTTGPRVAEAAARSVRWLDRSLAANAHPRTQCLFGIVQGGLDPQLRRDCVDALVQRDACAGYAIGGLSGGEAKDAFWRMVRLCTRRLPPHKPRYCMGVGYPEDMLVCIALGVDMFDCVYACRTARFGVALTSRGKVQLTRAEYAADMAPLDAACGCSTCTTYTRAYLHCIAAKDSLAATLLSYHNIAYLIALTRGARAAILAGTFTQYVQSFFAAYYPAGDYPRWCVEALADVDIALLPPPPTTSSSQGTAAAASSEQHDKTPLP